jgi:hypothetical protein
MGNSQSSSLRSLYKTFNEKITEIVTQAINDGNTTQINKNIVNVDLGSGNTYNDCPAISVFQSIDSGQTITVSSALASEQNLKSIINNAVDQTAKSDQKSVNDFLSLGFNNNRNSTTLVSDITNIMNTKIVNQNIQRCNSILNNLNEGLIDFGDNNVYNCSDSSNPITSLQEIITTQFVNCISKTAIGLILEDEVMNKAVQDIESKQAAENKGITSLLSSLVGPLIIIAVIIVLVLIAKSVLTKNSSGSTLGSGGYGGGYGGAGVSVNARI